MAMSESGAAASRESSARWRSGDVESRREHSADSDEDEPMRQRERRWVVAVTLERLWFGDEILTGHTHTLPRATLLRVDGPPCVGSRHELSCMV